MKYEIIEFTQHFVEPLVTKFGHNHVDVDFKDKKCFVTIKFDTPMNEVSKLLTEIDLSGTILVKFTRYWIEIEYNT